VIIGQWFAPGISNEFVITPSTTTVIPSMETYGFGGKCMYPKDWTGSITVPEVVSSTLSNFVVDE
jgi:hypothetical protein